MKVKVSVSGPLACGKTYLLRKIQTMLEAEGFAAVSYSELAHFPDFTPVEVMVFTNDAPAKEAAA